MPKLIPDEKLVEHLNAVLPFELMAVQQHFIHVLILKTWSAPEVAAGIMAIDEVDLPNAMRIVDLLVSLGKTPILNDHPKIQIDQMPTPGSTFEGIFSAERAIEVKLANSMSAAKTDLEHDCLPTKHIELIEKPLSHRKGFEDWMKSCERAGLPRNEKHSPLSPVKLLKLNCYFAHLVFTINQQMIHSFVHWHNNKKALADAAWAASGGAMMQATSITNLLAKRRMSPSPIEGLVGEKYEAQIISSNTDEALIFSRAQALNCSAAANDACLTLSGTEFESACNKGAEYFKEMSVWNPGNALPKINNPCLDFERVLREYVWNGEGSTRVLA